MARSYEPCVVSQVRQNPRYTANTVAIITQLLSVLNMMFKKALLPTLLVCLLPLQAFARNYSVEAIIFSHVVEDQTAVVEWDENAPRNIRAQTRLDRLYREARQAEQEREEAEQMAAETAPESLEPTAAGQEPIETVVINELTELQTIHDRLVQSPGHELLQILSWRQSEANYQDSPIIPVLAEHMMGESW